MSKLLSIFFFILFAVSLQVRAINPQAVVVMVPGTLNSLVPGTEFGMIGDDYFSKDITNSIRKYGFETIIINDLNPIGEFEENGRVVFNQLKEWYLLRYPEKQVPIVLIGHSAGGFYALHASELNEELPIKIIVTISTPLKGTRLVDLIIGDRDPVVYKKSFRGLFQLSTENVQKFISRVKIDSDTVLFSVAGSQKMPPNILRVFKSKYISPTLYPFAKLIGEKSDGIISYNSARGNDVLINTKDRSILDFVDLSSELELRLDHPEQILDYRYFKMFGIRSASYVRRTQRAFYSDLAKKLRHALY